MTPEGNIQSSDGLDHFSFSEGEEKEVPIVFKDYADIFNENRALLDRVVTLMGQFSNNKHEDVSEFMLTFQLLLFRELKLPKEEFESRTSPWGSRNDLLVIMSYVKDFEAALKDFVRSGNNTRFLRRTLHKLHVQTYIKLRAFSKELVVTNEDLKSLQLIQITPANQDEFSLWTKCKENDSQNQIMVPWNLFFTILKTYLSNNENMKNAEELFLRKVIDNNGTGFVTIKSLDNFLKVFGPLRDSLNNLENFKSKAWFKNPFLSVIEGEALLEGKREGVYLVRFSQSRSDILALQYVDSNSKRVSVPILCQLPNVISVQQNGVSKEFSSVQELIDHYRKQKILTTPIASDLLSQPSFHGSLELSEAKEILFTKPPGTYLLHLIPDYNLSVVCSFVTSEWKYAHVKLHSYYVKETTKYEHLTHPKLGSPLDITTYNDISSFIKGHSEILKFEYSAAQGNASWDVPRDVAIKPILPEDDEEEPYYSRLVEQIYGPTPECVKTAPHNGSGTWDGTIFGQSMSNYPKGTGGDNVWCDYFQVQVINQCALIAIADGCNWGAKPKKAAETACRLTQEHIAKEIDSWAGSKVGHPMSFIDLSNFSLSSLSLVHQEILKEKYPGTTTLLSGMLCKIDSINPNEYGFVCVSVGDCKAFHWEKKTGRVKDITFGNRRNAHDASDCGGRLGPYLAKQQPDLRNLSSFFWPCETDDIILCMSDGIHDNLDPEPLGISPSEFDSRYTAWKDVPSKEAEMMKEAFQCKEMEKILREVPEKTPKNFVTALVIHSKNVTEKSRNYMEADPNAVEPKDYKEYPGKMDHATCIALKVGPFLPKLERRKRKIVPVKSKKTEREFLCKKYPDPFQFLKELIDDHFITIAACEKDTMPTKSSSNYSGSGNTNESTTAASSTSQGASQANASPTSMLSNPGLQAWLNKLLSTKTQPLIRHYIQNYYPVTGVEFHNLALGASFLNKVLCITIPRQLPEVITVSPYVVTCDNLVLMSNFAKQLPPPINNNNHSSPSRMMRHHGDGHPLTMSGEIPIKSHSAPIQTTAITTKNNNTQSSYGTSPSSILTSSGEFGSYKDGANDATPVAFGAVLPLTSKDSSSGRKSGGVGNNHWIKIQVSTTRSVLTLLNVEGAEDWELVSKHIPELEEQLRAAAQTHETVKDVLLNVCIGSIKKFHDSLVKINQEIKINFTVGVVCMLSDLQEGSCENQRSVFVGVNVGSNKIYYFSQRNAYLQDLTPYNYPIEEESQLVGTGVLSSSSTKKHGTLGSTSQSNCTMKIADNVKLIVYPCDHDLDYFLFLSSQFYDCFDPPGKIPKELQKQYHGQKSWSKVPYHDANRSQLRAEKLKQSIFENLVGSNKWTVSYQSFSQVLNSVKRKSLEKRKESKSLYSKKECMASCLILKLGQPNVLSSLVATQSSSVFNAFQNRDMSKGTIYFDLKTNDDGV